MSRNLSHLLSSRAQRHAVGEHPKVDRLQARGAAAAALRAARAQQALGQENEHLEQQVLQDEPRIVDSLIGSNRLYIASISFMSYPIVKAMKGCLGGAPGEHVLAPARLAQQLQRRQRLEELQEHHEDGEERHKAPEQLPSGPRLLAAAPLDGRQQAAEHPQQQGEQPGGEDRRQEAQRSQLAHVALGAEDHLHHAHLVVYHCEPHGDAEKDHEEVHVQHADTETIARL